MRLNNSQYKIQRLRYFIFSFMLFSMDNSFHAILVLGQGIDGFAHAVVTCGFTSQIWPRLFMAKSTDNNTF